MAKRLFAERGFYGVSLAAVAAELGLTKQALIHHFGTKERLYDEVLAQMARQLGGTLQRSREAAPEPAAQLEALMVGLLAAVFQYPEDNLLLMREILDNRPRAAQAHHWPLKGFIDGMAAMAQAAAGIGHTEAVARVYLLVGGINYFAVSEPTLRQMYEAEGFEALKAQAPAEVRRLVQAALKPA